jgi:hypothetical protein
MRNHLQQDRKSLLEGEGYLHVFAKWRLVNAVMSASHGWTQGRLGRRGDTGLDEGQ